MLYLMGNHEFYGHDIPRLTHKLEQETVGANVHVMENKAGKSVMWSSSAARCGRTSRWGMIRPSARQWRRGR